jgi:hypothetical protein
MVSRSERDDDERDVPLDRHVGHRCQRAVAARNSQRPCRFSRKLAGVVVGTQDMRSDPKLLGLAAKL